MGPEIALLAGLAGAGAGVAGATAATGTLATAASLLGAGASLLGGVGAYAQGRAAQAAAEAEAQQRRRMAIETLDVSAAREEALRRRARLLLAEQRTALASAGLSASRSALDMLLESADRAERDALELRRRGLARAGGYFADAEAWRERGRTAVLRGGFGMAEALFGAGSQLGRWWASRRPGFGPPLPRSGYTAGIPGPGGRLVGGV